MTRKEAIKKLRQLHDLEFEVGDGEDEEAIEALSKGIDALEREEAQAQKSKKVSRRKTCSSHS